MRIMKRVKNLKSKPFAPVIVILLAVVAGAAAFTASVLGRDGVLLSGLVACLSVPGGIAAIIGACLSLLFTGITPICCAGLGAALVALLVRIWFTGISSMRYPLAVTLSCTVTYLSGSLVSCIVSRSTAYEYLEAIALTMICAACTYCLASTFKTPSFKDIYRANCQSLVLLATLSVTLAENIRLADVGAGHFIYLFFLNAAIFCMARHKSCAFAALTSLGFLFYRGTPDIIGLYGAVFAALCPKKLKNSRSPIAFCSFVAFSAVTAFDGTFGIETLLSAAVASMLFALLPSGMFIKEEEYPDLHSFECRNYQGPMLRSKDCIEGLAMDVSGDDTYMSACGDVGDMVYASVCVGCERHSACFSDTDNNSGGFVGDKQLCTHFSTVKETAVLAKRKVEYSSKIAKELSGEREEFEKALRMTSLVIDDILASESMCSPELYCALNKSGFDAKACYLSKDGEITLYFDCGARINTSRLLDSVGMITGKKMFLLERSEEKGGLVIKLCPEMRLCVRAGVSSVAKDPSESPGDAYSLLEKGKYSFCILSDGMGTGEEAGRIASMLAYTVNKLIEGGFSPETAIALASERIKSAVNEESFATLDLLRINRLSGEAEIYKCGAGRSILIYNEGTVIVQGGGYPLGIMDEPCYVKRKVDINGLKAIVMMTDGGDSLDVFKVNEALQSRVDPFAEEVCASLAAAASHLQKENCRDDVTVSVININ